MSEFREIISRRKLAVVVVVVLAAIALVSRYGPTARLVYLEQQLLFAPEGDAADAALQLAETEPGLQILVSALCSVDESISERAGSGMLAAIDSWALLAEEVAAPKLDRTARVLATEAADISPAGRRTAYQIALRLLTWPTIGQIDGDHPRLADARYILKAVSVSSGVDRMHHATNSVERLLTRPPIRNRISTPAKSGNRELDVAVIDLPGLPGGNLPLASIDLRQDDEDFTAGASKESATSVRRVDSPSASSPPLLLIPADARPLMGPSLSNPDAAASLTLAEQPKEPQTQPYEPPAEMPSALRSAICDLCSGDLASVATVRIRLENLGLTPTEIAIAEQFASSDADVRRRLAESLAGVGGVDAKPWLIWLSHDVNPQVRLAALTIMATSGEPEMLARVAQLARVDRDPEVQRQAAKVASKIRR